MALDLDRVLLERAGELHAAARNIGMRGLGQQFGVRRNGLRWLGHQLAVADDQTGFDRGPRAGSAFEQAALDQQNVGALARWGHHRTTARPWAVGQIWSEKPQASRQLD